MALYGQKGMDWYNNIFTKFTWKNRNKIYAANAKRTGEAPGIHFHGGGKLKVFHGRHPSIMMNSRLSGKDLLKEFRSGMREPFYRISGPLELAAFLLRSIFYGYILRS